MNTNIKFLILMIGFGVVQSFLYAGTTMTNLLIVEMRGGFYGAPLSKQVQKATLLSAWRLPGGDWALPDFPGDFSFVVSFVDCITALPAARDNWSRGRVCCPRRLSG